MIKEEQFIQLFLRHEAELRGFAISLLFSIEDAQDVVQDACVAMWQRLADLDDEAGFVPWAYTFVRFTALNKIRKSQRSPLVFSDILVELNANEAEQESELARAERHALRECLKGLPPRQLELVRRFYASASVHMDEVAQQMAKPVSALYKSLQRTRAALRTCIERHLTKEGF